MDQQKLDAHLDTLLRAAGSALRHYSLPKSREDMRAALREAIDKAAAAEREECAKLCGAYWESLEEIGEDDYQTGRARAAVDLQNAITARSQPTKGKDQK